MNTSEQTETKPEYMQVIGFHDGEGEILGAIGRMQEYLAAHAPSRLSVAVRSERNVESAIYSIAPDGSKQVLGDSTPVPAEVQELFYAAARHALKTWPEKLR